MISRRTLLGLGAAVGGALFFAKCGPDESEELSSVYSGAYLGTVYGSLYGTSPRSDGDDSFLDTPVNPYDNDNYYEFNNEDAENAAKIMRKKQAGFRLSRSLFERLTNRSS